MVAKVLLLYISIFFFQKVQAEDLTIKEAGRVLASADIKEGWTPRIKLKSNISLSSSASVVGQVDGDSTTLGASIDAYLAFKSGQNEWRQELKYNGTTTKTPSLSKYVKSADEFNYISTYLRSLANYPSLGPYARLNLKTSVFKGEDVRAETKNYTERSTGADFGSHKVFRLTDGFIPLTTKESVGFFLKLIDRKETQLELRLGGGAIQVKTDGQLRVDDDDSTDTIIELSYLDDINQLGLEYGLLFKGKWNSFSDYSVSADFLTPFGVDIAEGKECDRCSSTELTNIDLKIALSTKISSWASLSYEYKALKQPEILNEFQLQHGFVLNFIYDVF